MSDLQRLFSVQCAAFAADRNPSYATRRGRLDRIEALCDAHEAELVEAIAQDFGVRPAQETRLAELFMVRVGVRHARRHLRAWMRSRAVPTPLYLWPGKSRVLRQPLGVVGVISPWNYPVQLALLPAVAALGAGNRVLLKPSELTPRTSALLERLANDRFAPDEFAVVMGGPVVGEAFARLPFVHLFFTGSTRVTSSCPSAPASSRLRCSSACAMTWRPCTKRFSGRYCRSNRTRRSTRRLPGSMPGRGRWRCTLSGATRGHANACCVRRW